MNLLAEAAGALILLGAWLLARLLWLIAEGI